MNERGVYGNRHTGRIVHPWHLNVGDTGVETQKSEPAEPVWRTPVVIAGAILAALFIVHRRPPPSEELRRQTRVVSSTQIG
jgi:hypothetical protein